MFVLFTYELAGSEVVNVSGDEHRLLIFRAKWVEESHVAQEIGINLVKIQFAIDIDLRCHLLKFDVRQSLPANRV